jgi:peptide/nickel transport system substrate-binding protein
VTRGEAAVRAAMVQAGEADLAVNISAEQAAPLPKSVTENTTEAVFVRLNTKNPILADINVRKAIAEAIDAASIREALYPGVSTPLNGQIVRRRWATIPISPTMPTMPKTPRPS